MRRLVLLIPALAFLLLPVAAFAAISNGENALDALGQYDDSLTNPQPVYTKGAANNAPNILGMSVANELALDPLHHRLFVGDNGNARVLVYTLSNANTIVSHIPSFVLGQPDFHSNTPSTTQSGMRGAEGIAYDSNHNRLFVSEYSNNRVLVFDVSTISNGMNASYVIGQPDFTSSGVTTVNQSGLYHPINLLYDTTNDRLFVDDNQHERILIFSGATLSNGMNANVVLGQTSFTGATTTAPSASAFQGVAGMAYDPASQHLFVSDHADNRVLVFSGALTNGMNASVVLGQNGFTTATGATTQSGMKSPFGLAFDPTTHHLFVHDEGNSRILVFSGGSLSNYMTANTVIGQSTFTTGTAGTTQSTMQNGFGAMAYDTTSNHLFVADSGNNRVLVFSGASLSNGMNATDALGQYDDSLTNPQPVYTKGAVNDSPNVLGINSPHNLTLDPTHHRLFVADTGNNRILVYNLSNDNQLLDRIPDNVLGQPDFHSNAAATTQSGMHNPFAVSYDTVHDRLFVADTYNYRVLVYDFSGATIQNGMNASNVLGYSDFTDTAGRSAQTEVNIPEALVYDSRHDRLFVADTWDQRVLVFDLSSGISNGMNASNVLGQPDFTSGTSATTQSGMDIPTGIAYDGVQNRLFVTDASGNRVLVFNFSGATIQNGMNASNVLGQPDFTSSGHTLTASGMYACGDLSFDAVHNRLFVGCAYQVRVLVFNTANITNGMNASYVLGEPDFTTAVTQTTQSGMGWTGNYVAYDATNDLLYVGDNYNSRVLLFDVAPVSASSSSAAAPSISDGGGGGSGGGSAKVTSSYVQQIAQQRFAEASSAASSDTTAPVSSAAATASSFLQATVSGKAVTFTDIPKTAWFASSIQTLVSEGIVSGYKDAQGHLLGKFGPGDPVTFAQVAKMAILGAGLSPSSATPHDLSARGQWSASYIAEAENLHLSPYATDVNVNAPMTRAAALDAILQAFQIPMQQYKGLYSDVTATTPYASAIATATTLGIVQGDTDASGKPTGTFRPLDPINRAEFARILVELMAEHGSASSAPAH